MTSLPDCGDCTPFAERALRAYQPLLTRYGFDAVDCTSDRGGRECVLMYRAHNAALLFILTDSAEATAIADPAAPFPTNGWSGVDGEDGWYSVVGLIEYHAKKKLMTRKLLDEFALGKRDALAWEAGLMNDWIERLMGLFAPDTPPTWQDDFSKYARTRRYG
jgi:hypothetical protein